MIKTVSINFRHDDRGCFHQIDELIEYFTNKNIEILLPQYDVLTNTLLSKFITDENNFVNKSDLIIAIGGDGTFLRTARQFVDTGKPIFGINRGRLGFLTEFSPDEYIECLDEVLQGDFQTTEKSLLEAVHLRKNKELKVLNFLNDAVISKGAFSRAIGIELEIDGDFLNAYTGDGLIISTSTGSTAYSLSAGGPIITPSAANIYLLNPVCPHTLAMRPMIIPSTSVVKARIISDFTNLLLTIDGQEAIRIEGEDEVLFRQSDKKIRLINHPRKNFYAILREKLGWG